MNSQATKPTAGGKAAKVALGSVAGALAIMAVARLPNFLLSTSLGLLGGGGSPGLWIQGLFSTCAGIVIGAFTTPWGLIGALIGGLVAWQRVKSQEEKAKWAGGDGNPPVLRPERGTAAGESSLAAGLLLALFSVGVFPSVMVWMLGFFTMPVAVALVFFGLTGIGSRGQSAGASAAGYSMILFGLMAAGVAAVGGTFLSCHIIDAMDIQPALASNPGAIWWLIALFSWGAAALLTAKGFRLWTNWTQRRRLIWCGAVCAFPVAAFALHFTLASIGILPLSA